MVCAILNTTAHIITHIKYHYTIKKLELSISKEKKKN